MVPVSATTVNRCQNHAFVSQTSANTYRSDFSARLGLALSAFLDWQRFVNLEFAHTVNRVNFPHRARP